MKLNFLLLCFLSLFIISCGSDDSCTQADWIGTYTGTSECDGEDPETVSIVITAGSNENSINIDGEEVTFDGCNASMSITDPFFGSEIDTDFELDGNSLKTSARVTLFGLTVNCSFEGTK